MKILIIRQDKLRIHQDYLYVKLYAKKNGVDADIKTIKDTLDPAMIVHYISQHGNEFDLILLDGDVGCNCDTVFNTEFRRYFSDPESAFIRPKVIVRSNSPFCVDCARQLHLTAVTDEDSWQLGEYIYEHDFPTSLQFMDRTNFGLMYSHI